MWLNYFNYFNYHILIWHNLIIFNYHIFTDKLVMLPLMLPFHGLLTLLSQHVCAWGGMDTNLQTVKTFKQVKAASYLENINCLLWAQLSHKFSVFISDFSKEPINKVYKCSRSQIELHWNSYIEHINQLYVDYAELY